MPRRASSRLLLLSVLTLLPTACGDGDSHSAAGPTAGPASAGTAEQPAARPRTIVLVSLDTLRPERLGVYGNSPDVSPVIDALAEQAAVFDTALAPSPWTLPSHMTMLTGLDPVAHGVLNDSMRLSEAADTLAARLQRAGYATGAFTDGGFVSGKYGFARGFDVFDDVRSKDGPNGFPRIMPRALDWLADQGQRELFLFLHTFDAHTPYDEVAPEILERFRARPVTPDARDAGLHWLGYLYKQVAVGVPDYQRMGALLNDYDAGVHEADLHLGRLFDALKADGRWDDALIIVTADHGESFFDHGLHVGHGLLLSDSELRVPLLLRLPGGRGGGRRFDDLVGLVDIARTVLELAGLPAGDDVQGESLLGLLNGAGRSLDFVLGASQNTRAYTLVREDYKYISPVGVRPMLIAQRHLGPVTPPGVLPVTDELTYELGGETLHYDAAGDPLGLLDVLPASEQLFDRRADPGELRNLATEQAAKLAELRRAFSHHYARSHELHERFPTAEVASDRASQAVLQTLGYLGTGDQDDLQGVPRALRQWALQPHQAPDSGLLQQADRRVHEVRLQLASGAAPAPDSADRLEAAAIEYDAWGRQNPRYLSRVSWRLADVVRLADQAGVSFSSPAWLVKVQQDQP